MSNISLVKQGQWQTTALITLARQSQRLAIPYLGVLDYAMGH